MSETKTYVFGEGGGSQNNGFDPNLLLGMMFGGGGFGGFGGGAGFLWPLFLLFAWMRNGFGGFGGNGNGFCGCNNGYEFLSQQINNSTGRELLMQAINGNGNAINQLSSTLGCQVGDIQNALHALSTQICQFSGQTGLGQQQIINALERGDASLANQMSMCCCDIRTAIQTCCCNTERAIAGVEGTVTRGFADVGYALRDQTCNLEKALAASTAQIIEGQRAAEMRELQRDLAERDRELAKKDVIINNSQQTATFSQMLTQATQPIYGAITHLQSDVDGIKCKLPKTEVVPVAQEYIPLNRSVNVAYGPYGVCGGAAFNGLGLGFNNGGFGFV